MGDDRFKMMFEDEEFKRDANVDRQATQRHVSQKSRHSISIMLINDYLFLSRRTKMQETMTQMIQILSNSENLNPTRKVHLTICSQERLKKTGREAMLKVMKKLIWQDLTGNRESKPRKGCQEVETKSPQKMLEFSQVDKLWQTTQNSARCNLKSMIDPKQLRREARRTPKERAMKLRKKK